MQEFEPYIRFLCVCENEHNGGKPSHRGCEPRPPSHVSWTFRPLLNLRDGPQTLSGSCRFMQVLMPAVSLGD